MHWVIQPGSGQTGGCTGSSFGGPSRVYRWARGSAQLNPWDSSLLVGPGEWEGVWDHPSGHQGQHLLE